MGRKIGFILFLTHMERNQLLRAPSGVGRRNRNSMRVDEGRKGQSLLAIKTPSKARKNRSGEEGEEPIFCDPGSELRLERREKRRAKMVNGRGKKKYITVGVSL